MTATHHSLHFEDLSPPDFERLCFWLARREGYEELELLGPSGSEDGCDLRAFRDGRRVVFQCKRREKLGPTEAEAAARKIMSLPSGERPQELVLVAAARLSKTTRNRVRQVAGPGVTCRFWGRDELDEAVKAKPALLWEFFRSLERPFQGHQAPLQGRGGQPRQGPAPKRRLPGMLGTLHQHSLDSPPKGSRQYDVFLSYSTKDKPAVEELARKLREAGLRPFLDSSDLLPGHPWPQALEAALRSSRSFAVLVGPSGLSYWTEKETSAALQRQALDSTFPVIPVLLPGAGESDTLPAFLASQTSVSFDSGLTDETAFQRLAEGITGHLPVPDDLPSSRTPRRGSRRRATLAILGAIVALLAVAGLNFRPLIDAASSPYALAACSIAALMFILAGARLRMARLLMAKITEVPQQDRRRVFEIAAGRVLPEGILPVDWIRYSQTRWRFFLLGSALIVILTISTLWILRPEVAPPPNREPQTLAVLGFAPRASDPGSDSMSMKLGVALVTNLRTHPAIQVLTEEWAAQFRTSAGATGILNERDLERLRARADSELATGVITGIWSTTGDLLHLHLDLRDLKRGQDCSLEVSGSVEDLDALARNVADKVDSRLSYGGLCLLQPWPSDDQARDLYFEGLKAWHGGQPSTAQRRFEEALELEPYHPILNLNLAQVSWDLAEMTKVERYAREALAHADRLPEVLELLVTATSHNLRECWEEALAAYEALRRIDPHELAYAVEQAELQIQAALPPEVRKEAWEALDGVSGDAQGVLAGRADLARARRFLDLGKVREARGLAKKAVGAGETTGVLALQADGLLVEAVASDRLSEYEEALRTLGRAEALFEKLGSPHGVLIVTLQRANILAQQERWQEAYRLYENYRNHFEQNGGERQVAIADFGQANVLIGMNRLPEAEEKLHSAAPVFERHGDQREQAQVNLTLGNVYFDTDRLDQAQEMYQQSLDFFLDNDDCENIATSIGNLGEVFYAKGETREAEWRLAEALRIVRELEDKDGEEYYQDKLDEVAAHQLGASDGVASTEPTQELRQVLSYTCH